VSVLDSLDTLRDAGYVTDEWARWQQGFCDVYALALMDSYPSLRFGVLFDSDGVERHFFAHDDQWAYDSAGRHPLPYRGVHDDDPMEQELDQTPDDFGAGESADPSETMAAHAHIRRHHIGPAT
jgi:hypothetical protein